MKTFYEKPVQLMCFTKFRFGSEWAPAIAYKDEVIRAFDGKVFKIEDLVKEAEERGLEYALYEYEEWADIDEAIMGDILPEGLVDYGDGAGIREE